MEVRNITTQYYTKKFNYKATDLRQDRKATTATTNQTRGNGVTESTPQILSNHRRSHYCTRLTRAILHTLLPLQNTIGELKHGNTWQISPQCNSPTEQEGQNAVRPPPIPSIRKPRPP